MKETYLKRAMAWIEADIDVTVDTIKSTIERLHIKKKDILASGRSNQDIIDDLNATIEYLNEELLLRTDDEEGLEKTLETKSMQPEATQNSSDNNQFDLSPLADYSEPTQCLSKREKAKALEEVKKLPGLLSVERINSLKRNVKDVAEKACA